MALRRTIITGLISAMFLPRCSIAFQGGGASSIVTLSGLRDTARPLLIFTPDPEDARLRDQLRVVKAHAMDAAERELVLVVVAEHGSTSAVHRLNEGDAVEARRKFKVSPGEFAIVLVGKDGGEKLRSDKPISFEKLEETIDAMPMRKDEKRSR